MDEEKHKWQLMQSGDTAFYPSQQPVNINFKEYVSIAGRRKWSFVFPFLIVVVLASMVALLLPAQFRSSATILIEDQEIPPEFVAATVTSFAEQRLEQINQRIMSTTRLLEIIEEFDLYKKIREKQTTEEIIDRMRKAVHLNQISTEVMDRRTGRPTVATIAFSLSYQGKDSPAKIQKVANVLVSLFLKENLAVRERQTEETSKFFEDELQRVQAELAAVEKKLAAFKEQHINELPDLLQLNMQQFSNTERNIERVEELLRNYKTQAGYQRTQLANISPYSENSDWSLLRNLRTELATLQSRYSDEHPDVAKAKSAIKALKEKLSTNGDNSDVDPEKPDNPAYITLSSQLASTESEIQSLKNQLRDLEKAKTTYETRIVATPRIESEYLEMISEQRNLRVKFDDLMQKLMEAKVAHGLEKGQKGERFTLIDPPRLPERPFKPNRKAIAVIGVVLGIGVGIGWAALREFSDQSVHSVDRLAATAALPILGAVPDILLDKDMWRIRLRRIIITASLCLALIGAVLVFHFFVMDLYVFWAKVDRRLMF